MTFPATDGVSALALGYASATMPPTRPASEDSNDDFARIYAEHLDAVYKTALDVIRDRQLAEDVTQDVFLDLWRQPERYDPTRGKLRPYLRLRARSRALDTYRASRARVRLEDRLLGVVATGSTAAPDAASNAAAREQRRVLANALRRLPDEQRDAVALAHLAGFTAGEVAVAHRIPLGTAKSRVRLGLEKLRESVTPVPLHQPSS